MLQHKIFEFKVVLSCALKLLPRVHFPLHFGKSLVRKTFTKIVHEYFLRNFICVQHEAKETPNYCCCCFPLFAPARVLHLFIKCAAY